MKSYEYHSQLAPHISGLIRQKRADGYIYEFEAYMLERFDRFCIESRHDSCSLTRDLVMAWAEQRPTESKNYRNQRVSFVRQLALYMISLNMETYIPRAFESNTISVPYILSLNELHEFYKVVDSFLPCQSNFQFLIILQCVVQAVLLLWAAVVRSLLSEKIRSQFRKWLPFHLPIKGA